jgi:endonuclease-8
MRRSPGRRSPSAPPTPAAAWPASSGSTDACWSRCGHTARTLGEALLDQGLLAGIGNIFKSEACFAAGVSPWRRLTATDDEQLRAVLRCAREHMLAAVASGREEFTIYRRRGPCVRCQGRVCSRGQGDANRITWWCERCQG